MGIPWLAEQLSGSQDGVTAQKTWIISVLTRYLAGQFVVLAKCVLVFSKEYKA